MAASDLSTAMLDQRVHYDETKKKSLNFEAILGVDPYLVRWADSFMQNGRIRLKMEGRTGAEHSIESGIPQGSPVRPVLFAVHISEMFGYVEERADAKALSFVDDVAWWAEGRTETEVAR